MEHGTVLFTAAIAFVGQLAKSHPGIKNWIPQALMLALGVGFYGINHGWPHGTGAQIVDWIEAALLGAAAIPGAASVVGSLVPGLKTR